MLRPPLHRHLVLYGSLRRHEPAFDTLGLARSLGFVRRVRFPGRMYDLGDFPGVILAAGRVQGELHFVRRMSVLATLDAFELYRPGDRRPYDAHADRGSLFLRQVRRIRGVRAYVYLYNGETRRGRRAPRIVRSGLWRVRRRPERGHLG